MLQELEQDARDASKHANAYDSTTSQLQEKNYSYECAEIAEVKNL